MRFLRKNLCIMLAVLLACAGHPAVSAKAEGRNGIENVVPKGNGYYTCTFDGVSHGFIVDLPEKAEGSPLILMLPGYGGTAESFRLETQFEKEANPLGYTVVYVTGAPDPADKTSAVGWNSGIGRSEKQDVAFLVSLAEYLQQCYRLDSSRTYAAGFSNGAFMAHRLALEAGDTFSAAVSVAGTVSESVWAARPAACSVSLLQITGEKDDVVPKKSDGSFRYAQSPAIEDVISYYAEGLELQETRPVGKGSVLAEYGSSLSGRHVWHLMVKEGRHSWPGERVTGVATSRFILEFLESLAG